MDAEALVRLPEITDAQEIARTKNDSWRVGYRGLLPDSILNGLDDGRSTTQWVQWLRDGYENAGLRAEVRVTTGRGTTWSALAPLVRIETCPTTQTAVSFGCSTSHRRIQNPECQVAPPRRGERFFCIAK